MNLYLISRSDKVDWDEYRSAVVVAENADIARRMHPENGQVDYDDNCHTWVSPEAVQVQYLGTSAESERRVVCADNKGS